MSNIWVGIISLWFYFYNQFEWQVISAERSLTSKASPPNFLKMNQKKYLTIMIVIESIEV